jgi:hypothetical protein
MLDSGELDWFSEGEVNESIPNVLDNHSLKNPSLPDTTDAVLAAAETVSPVDYRNTSVRAELYDSSCTKHISPYQYDPSIRSWQRIHWK